MERLTHKDQENYLRTNLGMLLIKPDSVQLGVAEWIIDYANQKVEEASVGQLNGVYIVQLTKESIPQIYSSVKAGVGEILKDYMIEDVSILVTFKGNGKDDIWEFLHSIRGKRLMDRTPDELDNGVQTKDGIRDFIPIPSTREEYTGSFKTLKERYWRGDSSNIILFKDEDYIKYCRNLVHVPDDLHEIAALLQLLGSEEIRQNISESRMKNISSVLSNN